MQRTAVSKRYVRFAENVALGELGLLVFVGAVFLLMGSRSVSEIGVGFMVAGFGLSILGTVSVARSVENSVSSQAAIAKLPPHLRNVDPRVAAAFTNSTTAYRFFWTAQVVAAIAFLLGTLLMELG